MKRILAAIRRLFTPKPKPYDGHRYNRMGTHPSAVDVTWVPERKP